MHNPYMVYDEVTFCCKVKSLNCRDDWDYIYITLYNDDLYDFDEDNYDDENHINIWLDRLEDTIQFRDALYDEILEIDDIEVSYHYE